MGLLRRIVAHWRMALVVAFVIVCLSIPGEYKCAAENDANQITCQNFSNWHLLSLWWHTLTIDPNWFVAIFTGVMMAIAYFQLGMFRKQLGVMRKGLGDSSASARAAAQSANAARLAADIADRTLMTANRPWLKIARVVFSPLSSRVSDEPNFLYTKAEIHVDNVGNSPALFINGFVFPVFDLPENEGNKLEQLVMEKIADVFLTMVQYGRGQTTFHGDSAVLENCRGGRPIPVDFDSDGKKLYVVVGVGYVVPSHPAEQRFTAILYRLNKPPAVFGVSPEASIKERLHATYLNLEPEQLRVFTN